MELTIHSGKRVLYKDGKSGWQVGVIDKGNAEVNEQGLWMPIIPMAFATLEHNDIPYIQYAEINNIFFDSFPIDDWVKGYKEYFMTKEEYIELIQNEGEDFDTAYGR